MRARTLIAAGVAAALSVGAVGLYWKGRAEGAARARDKVEAAQAQVRVSGLEVHGARAIAARVAEAQTQQDRVDRTVGDLTHQALKSEDADAPLTPDRTARLRDADRELCRLAPELAGCAADRDAGAGAGRLRAPPPARRAHPG